MLDLEPEENWLRHRLRRLRTARRSQADNALLRTMRAMTIHFGDGSS
jgi:hypothetical protein